MNVKKTVKKISALATGGAMLGMTLMGAMAIAPDLADYPDFMIEDGQFNGKIVVGANAASQDIIGSIDIAASLQAASTTETAVDGGSTTYEIEGDAAQIRQSGDALEISENLEDVKSTLTKDDLAFLADGRISISGSSTDYTQTIDLIDGATFQVRLDEDENNNDEVGVYLYAEEDDGLFEYEIEFESGLESDVDSDDDETLEDLEDETIVFMGQEYSVVTATVDDPAMTLELIAGDVVDTLTEGETKTYTVDGTDYEVTVLVIGTSGNNVVKFLINGETTDSLEEGDTDDLSDGLEVGVREVIETTAYRESDPGSVVEFYLGANKVILTDSDVETQDGTGDVEIDDEDLNDIVFDIVGTIDGTTDAEIDSLVYRVNVDPEDDGVWVHEGMGLREQLDDPNVFINPELDFMFAGLTDPGSTEIRFEASGDDSYDFVFTNNRGTEYDVGYMWGDNTDGGGFGEDDDDQFVFWEYVDGTTNTSVDVGLMEIDEDDYFLVTEDMDDPDGESFIIELDEIDTDSDAQELTFIDVATNDQITADYDSVIDVSAGLDSQDLVTPSGEVRIGGNEFNFWLLNDSDSYSVILDLNRDDLLAGLDYTDTADVNASTGDVEVINVVVRGGGFVALANASDLPFDDSGDETVWATLTTDEDELDEGADVVTTFKFSYTASTDELDADVQGTLEEVSDDDSALLTRYGAYVLEEEDDDDADSVTITYPREQVEALVYVVGGDAQRISQTTGGSTAQRVNPLPVGLAVLDTEVSVDDTNLIVVGGPCANTVAAELLGNPADCVEGFEAGMGMIRTFDTGDNVAVLAAGFSARDTVQSSQVLAEAAIGQVANLEGTDVEVVIAGANDVSVRAAMMDDN